MSRRRLEQQWKVPGEEIPGRNTGGKSPRPGPQGREQEGPSAEDQAWGPSVGARVGTQLGPRDNGGPGQEGA